MKKVFGVTAVALSFCSFAFADESGLLDKNAGIVSSVVHSAAAVSRYHCSIIRREGAFYLIDSSLNGTMLDDGPLERGEQQRLDDGAEFTVADVARFKFLLM